MLKENWRFISRLERCADALIIVLCFFAAYFGRDSLIYWNDRLRLGFQFGGDQLGPISDYSLVLFVALVSYLVLLNMLGAYSSMRLSSSWHLLRLSLASSLIVFLILAATLFLSKIDLSRSFIALFCSLVGLTLTAERFLVLKLLRYWRRKGMNYRNVVVCGVGDQALRMAHEVYKRPELGIRIRCFAHLGQSPLSQNVLEGFRRDLRRFGFQAIGRVISGKAGLEKALKEYAIDEVVFTDIMDVLPEVEEMVLVCSEQGVRTTLAADLFSLGMVKSGLSYFGDLPLIHFQTPPGDRWELSVKRLIDVAVSLSLLVLLWPVFAAIALAIKLDSVGPIFFRQRRVGLNGRLFDLIKFRSMRVGAEAELLKLMHKNEMIGPVFKIKKDPRITRVGAFLRRFSLDELPQLWNVLVGEMSLVGPRPPVPGEVSLYERKYRRRLSMRPGLTCTWQVSGRNEISDFSSWVKLDLDYIDNWSLGRDFWLLFQTIPAVILGRGAR